MAKEVDSVKIASTLAEKMQLAFAGRAKVTRPERRNTALLLSAPHWVKEADVLNGLTATVLTTSPGVSVMLKKGRDGHGYGTGHLMVLYDFSIKFAKADTVTVEWTKCRVKLLEKKQTKSFRC